jgi:mono/diheme cytochrome c family protein
MVRRLPILLAGVVLAASVSATTQQAPSAVAPVPSHDRAFDTQAIIDKTCAACHNERVQNGNLSLTGFAVSTAAGQREVSERMIRKLRAGQMPPMGARRPSEEQLTALAEALESRLDEEAKTEVAPGSRTFQRLNRTEYARAIRDLLGLDIDAGDYLPLDEMSANFDNIADAQRLSPTLMQGYLTAAAEISRLAVGDRSATPREVTYEVSRWQSQRERAEGAPYGSRGGLSIVHTFPADGQYRFRMSFFHETTGALYGNGRAALHTAEAPEQIEISIDGARAALFDVDRWMNSSDPDGVELRSEPIAITAGPHRVSAVFIRRLEGPVQDLIAPLEWSLASTSIADAYGFTTLPHLRDLAITGPFDVTGVSETPSRQRVFSCHPTSEPRQVACAREILQRLGSQAFRRTISERDLNGLMGLYKKGAGEGGFDSGIRLALEGLLASPKFVFRFEEPPARAAAGKAYELGAVDLASRLSFFLWAAPPDAALIAAAESGRLTTTAGLEREVRRLLADRRSDVLATRFAGQWLRLQDLDLINPDVRSYPDYDDQLKRAMKRETELFVQHIIRSDRSVLELFTADYTFADERLARHYRIPGVIGSEFRKVTYPDATRRGVLGHGSVLTLTSHAERTSPVLRGKWVLEVLLGTPPPAPPPNVPDLEATAESEEGRLRTVRERMEEHRNNAACASCHRMIDPIGLALEPFDVTGAWRIRDNGSPIDAKSAFYDGAVLTGPADLQQALMRRSTSLLRTFTENLMTYALGRRLDDVDMSTVRAVVSQAQAADYRFSAFVAAIVKAPAFRMKTTEPLRSTSSGSGQER